MHRRLSQKRFKEGGAYPLPHLEVLGLRFGDWVGSSSDRTENRKSHCVCAPEGAGRIAVWAVGSLSTSRGRKNVFLRLEGKANKDDSLITDSKKKTKKRKKAHPTNNETKNLPLIKRKR
jgi:hypothetical protein